MVARAVITPCPLSPIDGLVCSALGVCGWRGEDRPQLDVGHYLEVTIHGLGVRAARAARAASNMVSIGAGWPVQSSKARAPWWMSMGRPPSVGMSRAAAALRNGVSS